MFIAIRKEENGALYMDKRSYSRTETIKLTLEQFESFKQENAEHYYTFENIQELVKKEVIIESEDGQIEPVITYVEELVDFVLVTKRVFTDEQLSQAPYNYTKVEIDDKYSDCQSSDFNDDLTFSVDKYNARKQKELYKLELAELQPELDKLTEDLIQAQAGAIIPNLKERKARFQVIHNRIREIQGKEPREYI